MNDLADDIALLLDYFSIPKARAVIGVSQGGAATLNFAIRHPSRADCIIACDTQAKTPQANIKAWDDRIAFVQKEGIDAFAKATAERWCPPESSFHPDGGEKTEVLQKMIRETPVLGFEAGARALQGYDFLEAGLLRSSVKTLLVAGEKDGGLPAGLSKLQEEWSKEGGDVRFAPVKGAGHLPMLDCPDEFVKIVLEYIES